MDWQFKREEQKFDLIPEGKYRIRIRSVEKAVSKNGNDMLVFQFDVSGQRSILYHYLVFLNDKPEVTNRMLTQFFDSFKDIEDGNFNLASWVGKVGACTIKHDGDYARVGYFIKADKQGDLGDWKNPDGTVVDANGFTKVSDGIDDLPFV